jgi:hypothetical protein
MQFVFKIIIPMMSINLVSSATELYWWVKYSENIFCIGNNTILISILLIIPINIENYWRALFVKWLFSIVDLCIYFICIIIVMSNYYVSSATELYWWVKYSENIFCLGNNTILISLLLIIPINIENYFNEHHS